MIGAPGADGQMSECDNCGSQFEEDQLEDIQEYSMRVTPGYAAPSGQCPECGALCFPVAEEKPPAHWWLMLLDKPPFSFTAFGRTEEEAKAAMIEGWAAHRVQTGTTEDIAGDDVLVLAVRPGECWRNMSDLLWPPKG